MTPKQKKKMDEDERSGKGPTMMYGSKKKINNGICSKG
jgi:hypothetical protein